MLKHLATKPLPRSTAAICDECPTVTELKQVFNDEGKLVYCCTRCADKIAKGFLFGINPQKAKQHSYED